MEKIIFLFILVFGHTFTMFTTIGEQKTGTITKSSCVNDSMVLMCSPGYNITVLEALYGYTSSPDKNCSEGSIPECNRNLPFDVQLFCENRVNCRTITGHRDVSRPGCPSNRTNNLIVTYTCSTAALASSSSSSSSTTTITTTTVLSSSSPHASTNLSFSLMSTSTQKTTTPTITIPVTTINGIAERPLPGSTPYTNAGETTDNSGTSGTDRTSIYTPVLSLTKYVTTTQSEHPPTHKSTEIKLNPTSKIRNGENSGAIIGGAVGGSLFLVLLISLSVILICRHRMSHLQNLSTTKSSNIELLSGRDPSKVGTGEGELNQYVIETENSLYYAEASEHRSCHQNNSVDLIAGSSTQFIGEDDNGTITHHYTEIDNPKSHNPYDEIDSAMVQENTDKKDQRRHNQYEDITMEGQDDHHPCELENKSNPTLLKQNNNKIDQRCYNQYEDIDMEDQENSNNPCNSKKESQNPIYFELEPEGNHYNVIDIENETQVETPDQDLTTHYQASDDDEEQKANSSVDLNLLYAVSTKRRRSNDAFSKNAETAGSAEDVVMIENVIYNMEEE